jgi:uncharacterized protein
MHFKDPHFTPFPLLNSPHLQMITASYGPKGTPPPSSEMRVDIGQGDALSCQVSIPPNATEKTPIAILVHGLGGSYLSSYMIRLSRKFYQNGIKSVRVNLRNCAAARGLSRLPYNAGNSQDIKCVLEHLKRRYPSSSLILIGYSLGGNIAIKLAGEMGEEAAALIHHAIAVCPVLSLSDCIRRIESYPLYHRYYLKAIFAQNPERVSGKNIRSIYDYDTKITAPLWGYSSAEDYFEKCSAEKFLEHVQIPLDILLAKDDPFIDYKIIHNKKLSPSTTIWLTEHGSHTGFIGKEEFFWLDRFLLKQALGDGCGGPAL